MKISTARAQAALGVLNEYMQQNSGAAAGATTSPIAGARNAKKPAGKATGTKRRGRQPATATQ